MLHHKLRFISSQLMLMCYKSYYKIRWLKVHYSQMQCKSTIIDYTFNISYNFTIICLHTIAAYPRLTLSVSLGRLRGDDDRWRKVQCTSLGLGQLQDLRHTHTQAGKMRSSRNNAAFSQGAETPRGAMSLSCYPPTCGWEIYVSIHPNTV